MNIQINRGLRRRLIFSLILLCAASLPAFSQTEDVAKLRQQALALTEAQKFTEALPLLEKLAIVTPNDSEVQRNLGFALLGQAKNTKDPAKAKQLRARAHTAFVKAKEAGDDSPLVVGLINSIPADGGEDASFTANRKAEELMQQAEALFSSGKLDDALRLYQEALKLDPKLYHAALFSGDVYVHNQKYDEAEIWYQKAIAIDPNIETAYRYSATPLMKQGKYDLARDRYIEAWIVEPYSQFSIQGMVQWGQATNTRLGHPKIAIPETKTGTDGKETTQINVNPAADDGSMAWIAYSATRETWKKEKFARTFPNEKAYRHSLAEEADALRSVVSMARTLKAKTLHPDIALIEKMDKDGLLEAFVLMAIPDRGIATDHPAYLRSNRDKLRKYVANYVIAPKS